jgi:hypothetical protein
MQRIAVLGLMVILFTVGAASATTTAPTTAPARAAERGGSRVYLSPDGGRTATIVNEIANGKRSLKVQAYTRKRTKDWASDKGGA